MKYAICILAHKSPEHLERIVKKIKADNTQIFIHLDKKSNISEFSHIQNATFISTREKVCWGGRSMVKAMFNLIEYVVLNIDCEYIIFISGEDYPVIMPKDYDKYINIEKNYLEYKKLPKDDWYSGGMIRIMYYYLFRCPNSLLSRICVKLQKLTGIKRNINKLPFEVYGGSQWININRATAEYIINNWKQYYSFFRFCMIPDEMIFQTIILNSEQKDSTINTNYRYLRYNEVSSSNAAYIDNYDIEQIKMNKPLFCRKVKDLDIIKHLDLLMNEKG